MGIEDIQGNHRGSNRALKRRLMKYMEVPTVSEDLRIAMAGVQESLSPTEKRQLRNQRKRKSK